MLAVLLSLSLSLSLTSRNLLKARAKLQKVQSGKHSAGCLQLTATVYNSIGLFKAKCRHEQRMPSQVVLIYTVYMDTSVEVIFQLSGHHYKIFFPKLKHSMFSMGTGLIGCSPGGPAQSML